MISQQRLCFDSLILIGLFLATTLAMTAQADRMLDTLTPNLQVEQQLEQQLDLNLMFTDEEGKQVRLGTFFEKDKPVLLNLVYYGCPMLCGQVLNGIVTSLKEIDLDIDKDYEIVSVSFDHTEDASLAMKKKNSFVRLFHRENAEDGWHFLTSDSSSVAKLADQIGFKYFKDERTGQYAHSATIVLLTPTGKVSRYFFGVEYNPKDVQLGLVEASDEKIGSLADKLLLLCFQYDPLTGSYGFAITQALKISGILTVLILGAFMARSFARDRRLSKIQDQAKGFRPTV